MTALGLQIRLNKMGNWKENFPRRNLKTHDTPVIVFSLRPREKRVKRDRVRAEDNWGGVLV